MQDVVFKRSDQIIVNVSDAALTSDQEAVVATYALGSCLGLTVYDPITKVGGILHCLLPLSRQNPERAKENPFMFVDTGVSAFLNRFFEMGGSKDRMIVKAAGCGNMNDEDEKFRIGQRNHNVMRKILWKNNILIASERVGGSDPKTLFLHMKTGKVEIKTHKGIEEI